MNFPYTSKVYLKETRNYFSRAATNCHFSANIKCFTENKKMKNKYSIPWIIINYYYFYNNDDDNSKNNLVLTRHSPKVKWLFLETKQFPYIVLDTAQ